MYADRYGARPIDRRSLTLSTAIVGGLLATAMLSNTVIHRGIERTLGTYVVPRDPPPPPPPEPQPRPQQRADPMKTQVVRPDPIVETQQPVATFTTVPDIGPPPTLDYGTGDVASPIDPPKPPPVVRVADVDGRYLRDFQPAYPTEERRAGREGVVTLRVLIGVDGRVREVERVTATSDAFWRVTQERALSKWRFRPATRDGVAFETWKSMTVRFRLEED